MSIVGILVASGLGVLAVEAVYFRRYRLIIHAAKPDRGHAAGFFLAALMHGASILILLAALAPGRLPDTGYTILSATVFAGYIIQVLMTLTIDRSWRAAPLFWVATLAPLLGCVLVGLIWRSERLHSNGS
jgi:glycerol uptake facilitator-like aquaporin